MHPSELGYSANTLFSDGGSTSAQATKTRGPARQASFARAKNDPAKKAVKQQKMNEIVEWLMAALQNRSGYADFRSTFHQIKSNPDAIKSWTFAVDFMKAYNKTTLIVRDIPLL
jgi:hypothetical protein